MSDATRISEHILTSAACAFRLTFAVLLDLPLYSPDVTHLNAPIGIKNYLGFAIWQIRDEYGLKAVIVVFGYI